jgi:hypothetical protein
MGGFLTCCFDIVNFYGQSKYREMWLLVPPCQSVCVSSFPFWTTRLQVVGCLWKFGVVGFLENLSRKLKTVTLHEDYIGEGGERLKIYLKIGYCDWTEREKLIKQKAKYVTEIPLTIMCYQNFLLQPILNTKSSFYWWISWKTVPNGHVW